jgi:hypothetical protein
VFYIKEFNELKFFLIYSRIYYYVRDFNRRPNIEKAVDKLEGIVDFYFGFCKFRNEVGYNDMLF